MTLTRELLDTRYAWWFHNKRNAEQAKREILIIFSIQKPWSLQGPLRRTYCSSAPAQQIPPP